MGLAAGQARFLTITGRKSDCEFESMRLSHQKIALARELADLSNEYENSLNQTKLIYDYYGTGESSSPLSYGILMTPSVLNDYMPTTITDTAGRVVLNSQYAAAARAAGIPQEGIGTLPSDMMRNTFVNAMAANGIITENMRKTIQGLPYNQQAGFGGGATVVTETKEVSYSELTNMLNDYEINADSLIRGDLNSGWTDYVNLLDCNISANDYTGQIINSICYGNGNTSGSTDSTLKFGDILNGNYVITGTTARNMTSTIGNTKGLLDVIFNNTFWEEMFTAFEEILDTGDAYTQEALEYARNEITSLVSRPWDSSVNYDDHDKKQKWRYFNDDMFNSFALVSKNQKKVYATAERNARDYATSGGGIGINVYGNTDSHSDDNGYQSAISINLSTMMKAYLTYFYDFMNGISKVDSNGKDKYNVNKTIASSSLVGTTEKYIIRTGTDVSSDDLAQSQFYDALFNQICNNGWTENNNVDDNEYLQKMLQSGMLFVSRMKDDGYYYQSNYATDTYIKEVADESLIAQAEARYQTEKAKLNAKEQVLDLKMKNLDTEITSLTTEYESVKNTITKNVEKAFKRYSA